MERKKRVPDDGLFGERDWDREKYRERVCMDPNTLYRNVHTGPRYERNQDPLFPVVLFQFFVLVPVPFPCSVNKALARTYAPASMVD